MSEYVTQNVAGWNRHRLKWCFTSCRNGVWGEEPDGENDTPVVRVADFDRTRLCVRANIPTQRAISRTDRESRSLTRHDLLIEKSGGGDLQPVGVVVSYDSDTPAVYSNFVARLQVAPGFVPRFLTYLNASLYANGVNRRSIKQTTGIQNLDAQAYLSETVSIPDERTQQLITDYLDRETGEIDALIGEKEQMLSLLEEKRAALVTHAVTRGLDPTAPMKPSGLDWLGDIPEHWEVMQLKRTWSSSEYGISESIRDEGEIQVLRMSCITRDGLIDLNKAGQVDAVSDSLLLRKGDLLFNRTNSLDQIAKVGWLPNEPDSPTSYASYLVRLRLNERANHEYMVSLLNSRDFLLFARSNAIPAIGQANLSPTRYGDIEIALPPIREQLSIAAHIEKTSAKSKGVEKELRASIDLLAERRGALITAAVTGQIPIEEMRP